MRRRRMHSSSGIMPNCTQTSACLGLLLVMHLRCISIRPYRATLLQGSTHVGLAKHIENNACNNAPCRFIPNRWGAPLGTKLESIPTE